MEIKVRLSETDKLGHINNVSYFIYMEDARIDFLERQGLEVGVEGFAFLLASVKCNFVQQAYYGQILRVDTRVLRIGTKSLTLISNIYEKKSGELIAMGDATVVYFDTARQVSIKIPDLMKEQLQLSELH